ncbi:flagellar biosynthetic protein FliO [Bacillus spongiae]|uniref:Flagellar biosynthetic protein FliO n=1 Tax=Bacillus spongiae TaxID=2683610 RepID=A0ABU8HA98_9BACI
MRSQKKWMVVIVVIMSLLGWGESHPQASVNPSVADCVNASMEGCQKDSEEIDTEKTNEQMVSAPTVSMMDFIKMIVALLFVIGLIYTLLRFISQRSRSFQQTKLLHNLGGTSLGGNRSVQVVKVGNRILVLGVGEDIHLIKEIDEAKEYEEFITSFENNYENLLKGSNPLVRGWSKRMKGKKETDLPFRSLFKSQLDDLKKGRKNMFNELKKEENSLDE